MRWPGLLLLGLIIPTLCLAQPPAQREFYGRRLEPKESVVLHGAGQSDETSFAEYTKAMGAAKPMLSMSYVDLRDDLPGYFLRIRSELARYPELIVPQIGLSMNADATAGHYEAAVGQGLEDVRLEQLCAGLKSLGRPVFLRIGYEFNGSWNGYKAAEYATAFRRIAKTIRAAKLENVALVWDWSSDAELDRERGGGRPDEAMQRAADFYPGDDAVDWWGINLFSAESLSASATQTFLLDAARHRMPVMIGESAPRGYAVSEGQQAVDHWYLPYFDLIRRSPGVKAFCYIDWDWRRFPQWSDWGNSRVQDDPVVLRFYKEQVAAALYADAQSRAATMRLLRAY